MQVLLSIRLIFVFKVVLNKPGIRRNAFVSVKYHERKYARLFKKANGMMFPNMLTYGHIK